MCWGLCVVLAERPAGAVASGLHAQEKDSTAVGETRGGLPGGLVGLVKLEVAQAAAVGIDEAGLALRREEEPMAARRVGSPTFRLLASGPRGQNSGCHHRAKEVAAAVQSGAR